MADNVPLPAAAGICAADEVTYSGDTTKVQLSRLVHVSGSEGSKTLAEICDAFGLWVVPHRDQLKVEVTSAGLTIATTAYVAGDQLGSQFTIANAGRISGGTGRIVGIDVISAADIIGALDIVIFNSSVSLAADNSAFAISDADALKAIKLVNLAGAWDLGNNRMAQSGNICVPYTCSGGTSLYAGLITRSGHTFFAATTDLQLNVYCDRD